MNPKDKPGQGLSASNRDLGRNWHGVALGAVAAVLLFIYVVSRKLIFG
jgi:hypothetical protein